MNYETMTINKKDYDLKLTIKGLMNVEKSLGMNPIMIFGRGDVVPTITQMLIVFHEALQSKYKCTKTESDNLFEKWIDEGNSVIDFIPILMNIYKVSGIITDSKDDDSEKN